MTSKYENLISHFLSLDSGLRIRKKLEDDISSVTTAVNRPASITDRTDVGFTMRNYLNWYEAPASINEPPAIQVVYVPSASGETLQLTFIHSEDTNVMDQPILEEASQTFLQAVSSGDRVTVTNMLSRGASIAERSPDGLTALHYCALYDDKQMADLLLDHDASMNAKSNERLTPFDLAIKEHSWNVASLLIERNCALGSLTGNIFKLMRESEDSSMWRPVLRSLAQRFNNSQSAPQLLHRSIELHDTQALTMLLDEGFDPNISDEGTLC